MMKTIESVTEEDIAKYGRANVEIICDGLFDILKHQMKVVRDRVNNKIGWILEVGSTAKSYEDMTKEELIAELKKQK